MVRDQPGEAGGVAAKRDARPVGGANVRAAGVEVPQDEDLESGFIFRKNAQFRLVQFAHFIGSEDTLRPVDDFGEGGEFFDGLLRLDMDRDLET